MLVKMRIYHFLFFNPIKLTYFTNKMEAIFILFTESTKGQGNLLFASL